MIDNDCVMGCRARQSVAPDIFAAVEVSPCVAGDVLAVNPQVDMELIGVRGPGAEICAADDGFAICVVEEEYSPIGK